MNLFKEYDELVVRAPLPQSISEIEKILDIEEQIIKKYVSQNPIQTQSVRAIEKVYNAIFLEMSTQTEKIALSEKLLQEYLLVRENKEDDSSAGIRGLFSGAFLQLTYERDRAGALSFNGEGRTFNYLFFQTKEIKNLFLENITGNCILENAGSFGGNIQNILTYNLVGDYLLAGIGNRGTAEGIIADTIKGTGTFCFASFKNVLKNILALRIVGSETFHQIGCYDGEIKNILAKNVIGDGTFANLSFQKKERNIIATEIFGNHILHNAGDFVKENVVTDRTITDLQRKKVEEIDTLVQTMQTCSGEERKKLHKEVAELQEQLFGEK